MHVLNGVRCTTLLSGGSGLGSQQAFSCGCCTNFSLRLSVGSRMKVFQPHVPHGCSCLSPDSIGRHFPALSSPLRFQGLGCRATWQHDFSPEDWLGIEITSRKACCPVMSLLSPMDGLAFESRRRSIEMLKSQQEPVPPLVSTPFVCVIAIKTPVGC
ncbi:predicted protein [Coccidioides posadasii str. Silveira]|uniref:Predicted protein n=1 Tax=Coccidioides posadasii (strain RMSCC 757 / Silveira) TaxID=443226 RepID=E9DI45_COCPS|nr:predicted protein [Coccidioides posadasii str. Silveira]